jgi:hypothetical protein
MQAMVFVATPSGLSAQRAAMIPAGFKTSGPSLKIAVGTHVRRVTAQKARSQLESGSPLRSLLRAAQIRDKTKQIHKGGPPFNLMLSIQSH